MAVYKILIKGANGALAFATEKKEVTTKEIQTIDGVDTIVEVGAGRYVTGVFESEDVEIVKKKYVELMDTYKKDQLNCVIDVPEIVNITVDIEEESKSDSEPGTNTDDGSDDDVDGGNTTPSQPSGDDEGEDDAVDEPVVDPEQNDGTGSEPGSEDNTDVSGGDSQDNTEETETTGEND